MKTGSAVSQRYESAFCIFLAAIVFLFRDNPYLEYPQIFYLLLLLLGLNLSAGVALRVKGFGRQLAAALILGNCATIAAILSYSGEQASNLWVLYLLPIYTSCLLLDGREVALISLGAVLSNSLYYALSTVTWDAAVLFELLVKSAIFIFAAATTWKVVLRERSSRRLLVQSNEERERTENYLHLFRRLIGQIDDALLVINPHSSRLVDINGTWSRSLGYSREELKNSALAQWPGFLPDGVSWPQWAARVRERKSIRLECEPKGRDGTPHPMEIRFQWASQEGKDHIIAVARDISDRKRSEMQLRQSQKMDAVGRMAAGVVHDFNKMLSVILGANDLLLERCAPESPMRPELDLIRRAGDGCAALTTQLLAFTRQQPARARAIDINESVREGQRMLEKLLVSPVRVKTELFQEPGLVRIDPTHLQQVLINLALNARDAMAGGGTVTIATLNARLLEEVVAAHDTVPPGDYVLLRVEDTGAGMSADVLEHLFEPFFTTKAPGKGTGLGLSVIHGIVKQCGGFVQVRSEPGRGAAFTLYFPRIAAEETAGQPQGSAGAPARAGR